MTDCPADILLDEFGEICMIWLRREHPNSTFVYGETNCESALFYAQRTQDFPWSATSVNSAQIVSRIYTGEWERR